MKASQTQNQNIMKPLSSFPGWWELVTKLWQMALTPTNLSSVLKYLAWILGASMSLPRSSLRLPLLELNSRTNDNLEHHD